MGRATDNASNDDPPTVREPAGKVEVDSDGNRVWRWAREVLENTSVLLKRLENKDLALDPTQKVPVIRGADPVEKKDAGQRGVPTADKGGVNESTSGLLKRLENKDLALEPTQKVRLLRGAPTADDEESPVRRDGDGGFDPYNSR